MNNGWICPKCRKVYAPSVTTCFMCNCFANLPQRAKRGDEVKHKNGATGIVLHVSKTQYEVGACNISGAVSYWDFDDAALVSGA